MRVAINGFGRIGRLCFRSLRKRYPEIEIVAINDLTDPAHNAHLLKYDTNYGPYDGTVSADGRSLIVDGERIDIYAERDWTNLPWQELGIDVVIEATGVGTKRDFAERHLAAGARRVVISAPSSDADVMLVLGVNDSNYDPDSHRIISNASCTTNGLAPAVKVVHDAFGIRKGQMTTVHAYTSSQSLVDTATSDLRDARAAGANIVPAATGAARAIGQVIPDLNGRLDGAAYRVPTATVSIVEFVVELDRETDADEINRTLRAASQNHLSGILDVSDEPLVSADLKGNEHSSIVDSASTMVVGGNLAKIAAWYDNEWGYASRLADVVNMIGCETAQN
jgi:glyceraldehyde 3-phosphate dehydrogenase